MSYSFATADASESLDVLDLSSVTTPDDGRSDKGLPVRYRGCIVVYQQVRPLPSGRAILTELRPVKEASLSIGGNLACLSSILETVGSTFVSSERNPQRGMLDFGDTSRSLNFIPAGDSLEATGRGVQAVRHLVLEFSPTLLNQIALSNRIANFDDLRQGLSDPCLSMLCQIFASEVFQSQHASDLFAISIATALATRLAVIEQTRFGENGGLAPWQYRRVVDYMMSRLGEQVSLEKLADLVQLSKSYFCHAFRLTVGTTPYQWQLNARVRHAKSLILKNDLPLAQIALEAGFADQAHFTRVFRKFEGICPGRWTRYNRQDNLRHSPPQAG
jgi:AraC-like DNA-binding protein